MKSEEIIKQLDMMYPNPVCELKYTKDYELLIATVLSAQAKDKVVNSVTEVLFTKYSLEALAKANKDDIIKIIYPVGTYERKASYIIEIAKYLTVYTGGKVPNDRIVLESLPGVGRKTCNVVLSELYGEPSIAVDTHVARVSKRLGLTESSDALQIEKDLMNIFPKEKWHRLHLQLVLFGRYTCQSKKPLCDLCPFNCSYKK